jgi:archaellum component FlaG (FlaF/FlaG flagellin family)
VIDSYSDEVSDEASILEGEMRSRMTIINDPLYVQYVNSTGNLTFYIKNTGTADLSLDELVVSANGTARSGNNISITMLGSSSAWKPGGTIQVTFNAPGLREGVDYVGWTSTSGLLDNKQVRGSAQDIMIFQIRGV